MRIAFMGTPDFAVPTLKAVIEAGHNVVAVYSQPPARSGRGKKLRLAPVHQIAEAAGIAVFTPKSMRDEKAVADWQSLDLDIAVVVAYGQILPQSILEAPKYGCVNVHASLLPRWRGAAPIHRALMAGDSKTGVCIMKMEAGLDTGPVLDCTAVPITKTDTTLSLHNQLAQLGGTMIGPVITGLVKGVIRPKSQSHEGVTYAHKVEKSEARINWNTPSVTIDFQVRGLNPFPGAWTMLGKERLKILSGESVDDPSSTDLIAGTLLDDQLLVRTATGAYRITYCQRAGSKAMPTQDVLRGLGAPKGMVLA